MAPDNQTATTPIDTIERILVQKLERGELELPPLPQVASQVMARIGQLALQQIATIESFIDNVFNFPTYAETYRVAALDIAGQTAKRRTAQAA